jgi:hypothetical protein
MSSAIVAAFLFALVVVAALYLPLVRESAFDRVVDAGEVERLHDQKARCLQVLRDLELDNATGKVSSVDYAQTKTQLQVDLAVILERIEGGPRG